MLSTRKATSKDCTLIHQMAHEAFTATYENLLTTEQMEYMLNWMYDIPNIQKQMEEGHTYFIAYYDQEPCGYMSVEQQDENIFHLQKLYVLPGFQGKQIGKHLFNKTIEYVKGIHPEPCLIELNVNRNNKAVAFYERMGMKKLREGDFPIGNGYYMNDYIMGIEIK